MADRPEVDYFLGCSLVVSGLLPLIVKWSGGFLVSVVFLGCLTGFVDRRAVVFKRV